MTWQESSISVESEAVYSYGQVMRFSLLASGTSPIRKVALLVQVPELPNTLTADITLTPDEVIDVTHVLDLTQMRLAPFTTVTYWWILEDENSNRLETDQQQIEYIDDQLEWHRLERDDIQVYWSGEDATIGQTAHDAVSNSLPRIENLIPIDQPEPLRVYVYPSAADLRAGLRLTGRNWVGGHAHPELGVILVAANGPLTAAAELDQSIPHELAHLYLHEATDAGYETMPLWFDEGIATLLEAKPNPNYAARLDEAIERDETIALAELCYTLPSDEDQALLAYAQSTAVVRYIQSEYGNQALQQMIVETANGADCQSVTLRALGISLAELNQDWLDHDVPQTVFQRIWRNGRGWLLIVVAGFLLAGVLIGLPKGRNR